MQSRGQRFEKHCRLRKDGVCDSGLFLRIVDGDIDCRERNFQ